MVWSSYGYHKGQDHKWKNHSLGSGSRSTCQNFLWSQFIYIDSVEIIACLLLGFICFILVFVSVIFEARSHVVQAGFKLLM